MAFGDRLDAWLAVLPRYAELQQRESAHVEEHLAAGVPIAGSMHSRLNTKHSSRATCPSNR